MSSSPNEKKNSDVEMGEASTILPTPAMHESSPTFVAGFLSFKERLSRRSAEKEVTRTHAETSAALSSSAMSSSAEGKKSPSDAAPFLGSDTALAAAPEISAQPSGSSTTPAPIPKEGKATELMPPPLDRKEIVLGLPAASAAPLPRSRKRGGTAAKSAKKRRCTQGTEGEPSRLLALQRTKFVSLIDGVLSDCDLEIERLTKDLTEVREAKKKVEDVLKSVENTHTGEVSRLEFNVSNLERDLGKSASSYPLFVECMLISRFMRRLVKTYRPKRRGRFWDLILGL
ncbi:hypothetical protein Bca101_082673 [Brassica carinata]